MHDIIDLTPYLPQARPVRRKRNRRRFGSLAAAVECIVTLCIGAAVLVAVIAFLAAL